MTVSRSGQIFSPCTHQSSPVLAITVTSASAATPGSRPARDAVQQSLQEPGTAHAAGEHGDAADGASTAWRTACRRAVEPVWTTPRNGGSGFCVYQTRA